MPTVDPPDSFVESLQGWWANDPLEIIIVTVPRDHAQVEQMVAEFRRRELGRCMPEASADRETERQVDEDALASRLRVLVHAEASSKRRQLAQGIRASSGRILALSDDDVVWPASGSLLTTLLAPFHGSGKSGRTVGASGGPKTPYIPPERQRADIATA